MRISIATVIGVLLSSVVTAAQGRVFTTGTPAEVELARSIALQHLSTIGSRRGANDELLVTRVTIDDLSMAHVRVQQYFRGIPVFGGEAIAHLRSDGELSSITDNLVPDVRVDTTPRVTKEVAVAAARLAVRREEARPEISLWILPREGLHHLTYRVEMPVQASPTASAPIVFVDAHAGQVVWQYDNVQQLR